MPLRRETEIVYFACGSIFLLLFRATKHTNYAKEVLTLLTQCFVTWPPNLAKLIKWSRFINVHTVKIIA